MRRLMTLVFAANVMAGCAAMSSSTSSTSAVQANESMSSLPPVPQQEEAPKLEAKQVWVPGYYEPIAGTWMWHKGRVTDEKDGYRIMPASYREDGGKVVFTPPRWRRADLATSTASK